MNCFSTLLLVCNCIASLLLLDFQALVFVPVETTASVLEGNNVTINYNITEPVGAVFANNFYFKLEVNFIGASKLF